MYSERKKVNVGMPSLYDLLGGLFPLSKIIFLSDGVRGFQLVIVQYVSKQFCIP